MCRKIEKQRETHIKTKQYITFSVCTYLFMVTINHGQAETKPIEARIIPVWVLLKVFSVELDAIWILGGQG